MKYQKTTLHVNWNIINAIIITMQPNVFHSFLLCVLGAVVSVCVCVFVSVYEIGFSFIFSACVCVYKYKMYMSRGLSLSSIIIIILLCVYMKKKSLFYNSIANVLSIYSVDILIILFYFSFLLTCRVLYVWICVNERSILYKYTQHTIHIGRQAGNRIHKYTNWYNQSRTQHTHRPTDLDAHIVTIHILIHWMGKNDACCIRYVYYHYPYPGSKLYDMNFKWHTPAHLSYHVIRKQNKRETRRRWILNVSLCLLVGWLVGGCIFFLHHFSAFIAKLLKTNRVTPARKQKGEKTNKKSGIANKI